MNTCGRQSRCATLPNSLDLLRHRRKRPPRGRRFADLPRFRRHRRILLPSLRLGQRLAADAAELPGLSLERPRPAGPPRHQRGSDPQPPGPLARHPETDDTTLPFALYQLGPQLLPVLVPNGARYRASRMRVILDLLLTSPTLKDALHQSAMITSRPDLTPAPPETGEKLNSSSARPRLSGRSCYSARCAPPAGATVQSAAPALQGQNCGASDLLSYPASPPQGSSDSPAFTPLIPAARGPLEGQPQGRFETWFERMEGRVRGGSFWTIRRGDRCDGCVGYDGGWGTLIGANRYVR